MDIEIGKSNPIEIEIGSTSDFEIENDVKMYRGPKGDTGPMGPQGPKGDPGNPNAYMTYIDLSIDMEKPTELSDYINKSGVYVAKNKGFVGFNEEAFTILAEGQFFEVQNLKELYELIDEELPDEYNMINVTIPSIEGYIYYLKYQNGEWSDSVNITSDNINDYVNVDIDTRRLLDKYNNVSAAYGIYMNGNYLSIYPASQYDINNGTDFYKPITSNMIDYAVQKKGEKHFPTKEEFNTLKNDTDKILSDISSILDTVVTVDE